MLVMQEEAVRGTVGVSDELSHVGGLGTDRRAGSFSLGRGSASVSAWHWGCYLHAQKEDGWKCSAEMGNEG